MNDKDKNDNAMFDESILDMVVRLGALGLLFLIVICSFCYCSFFYDNSNNKNTPQVTVGTSILSLETTVTDDIKDLEYYKSYYDAHHFARRVFSFGLR